MTHDVKSALLSLTAGAETRSAANSIKPPCIIEKEERKVNYFSAETQKSDGR